MDKQKLIHQAVLLFTTIALGLFAIRFLIFNSLFGNIPGNSMIGTIVIYPAILSALVALYLYSVERTLNKTGKLTNSLGRLVIVFYAIGVVIDRFVVPIGHLDCADSCDGISFTLHQENVISICILISFVAVGLTYHFYVTSRIKSHTQN